MQAQSTTCAASVQASQCEAEKGARELGIEHRYTGEPMWDMWQDSALLKDYLGEIGPTTIDNVADRIAMCAAYAAGWLEADADLGSAR